MSYIWTTHTPLINDRCDAKVHGSCTLVSGCPVAKTTCHSLLTDTLQYTAVHCSTLRHTAAHCSTLQHTAAHCNTLQHTATHFFVSLFLSRSHRSDRNKRGEKKSCVAACLSVFLCVAVCCSVLQCVAVCCSVETCHACDTSIRTWHDSCMCVTQLMYMCDVTHKYVWRDSSVRVTHGLCIYLSRLCSVRTRQISLMGSECVVVCCSVLQCAAACCSVQRCENASHRSRYWAEMWRVLSFALWHVSHERVTCDMSHMKASHRTYEWVMAHVRMSHVIHTNASRNLASGSPVATTTCHIWTHHVTRINESWNTYEQLRHVTDIKKSCQTHWSKEPPPPRGVSYLLCSLIKNRE